MTTPQDSLLRAGASEQLLNDFNALKESTTLDGEPKYRLYPTLESLAKIITGQAGAAKDRPLFELCHFVYGVRAVLGPSAEIDLFLSPHKAVPTVFREALQNTSNDQNVHISNEALEVTFDTGTFAVRFGRMPVLGALYEFLTSMDGFSAFEDIQSIFDDLCTAPFGDTAFRKTANGLGAIFRKYRMAHLVTQQNDAKFQRVIKFLMERSTGQQIIFDDHTIFEFWHLHNKGNDYKGYRTVFDLFYDFSEAMSECGARTYALNAARLGLDHDAGDIDVSDEDRDTTIEEEWENPFDIFDDPALSSVRFFKHKSERKPLEKLMSYGPGVVDLPLAFIRYETFGQVQSAITTDLQVGRGNDALKRRITCEDIQSYQARLDELKSILEHIERLLEASAHRAMDGKNETVVAFDDQMRQKAANSFSSLKRKGFDTETDADIFKRALPALSALETRLQRYLIRLRKIKVEEEFDPDLKRFRQEFETLYGELLT